MEHIVGKRQNASQIQLITDIFLSRLKLNIVFHASVWYLKASEVESLMEGNFWTHHAATSGSSRAGSESVHLIL